MKKITMFSRNKKSSIKSIRKPNQPVWYKLDVESAAKKLGVDAGLGLSHGEALRRLEAYGPNNLPEESNNGRFAVLLRQIQSPLVYILLFAAFITLTLSHFSDTFIIVFTILINVGIGYLQERRANNTLTELKAVVKDKATVFREGEVTVVQSSQVVPGDIIVLRAGDKVPADARLLVANNLEAVEATLTGESVPSQKHVEILPHETPVADQNNMVFMGTEVAFGKGQAMVVSTGQQTAIGSIARMIAEGGETRTPLQSSLTQFARMLSAIVLGLSFFLLFVGLVQGRGFLDMLVTAVAVAVAAIPEGLLISMTVILAVGMQRILRKRGLTRHMAAAETLGSTSVICTDKTGTLTLGEMRVTSLVTASEQLHPQQDLSSARQSKALSNILYHALFANEAIIENSASNFTDWKVIGSPTDKALLIAAAELGIDRNTLEAKYAELSELPFDEKRKYAASLRQDGTHHNILYVKGAAEIVLRLCTHIDINGRTEPDGERVMKVMRKRFEQMTGKGLRVLGVAYKRLPLDQKVIKPELISDLVFVGFIGLSDPVREEVPASIADAKAAGLRTVIITGDHKLTALTIARQAGLEISDYEVMEGSKLSELSDDHLQEKISEIRMYSRVTPEHKLRIINAWQQAGEVVAMTGDGVNDAPALQKADIGISMGSGTEVARAASDLVLLDNNFKTIVSAIEQGRIIFNNIRRVILFLMFDAFQELILITGALVLNLPIPLLPAQILWNNVVNDGFPNLALTVEPGEKDVMKNPPRRRNEPLVNNYMRSMILVVGTIIDVAFIFLYLWLLPRFDIEVIRSLFFLLFGFSSLISAFALKDLFQPIWKINLFSNLWLVGAVLCGIAIQFAAIHTSVLQNLLQILPLPMELWSIVVALSFVKIFAIELTKFFYRLRSRFGQGRALTPKPVS